MKINVRGIPADGLEISKTIEPAELGIAEDDITCLEPFEVLVKAERITNIVVAEVDLRGKFSFVCSRCLEEVERDRRQHFKFEYTLERDTEFIDVGEDLRQEILLDLPAKVLCKDDCRGICMHCGANLNEEDCQCSK